MTLHGMPIVVSEEALVFRWVFPVDRFIEYEPKDKAWCQPLGIGHGVWEPGAYQIGSVLVVHPAVYEALRKDSRVCKI